VERESAETSVRETSRIEAFSDAVFAIAITLLVLDLHVPVAKPNETLLLVLFSDWVSHLAFLIGFFTILVCWINHHYMFGLIRRSNGMLLLLNGFKLLVVTFTPFATAVLSKYLATPQREAAVNIYAFNFFLMGLSMFGIFHYAHRKGLTVAAPGEFLAAVEHLYILAPVLSGAILLLSFVSVWVCLVLAGAMFLFFLFPKNAVARLERVFA
jgi:uncharacterized membrane protein